MSITRYFNLVLNAGTGVYPVINVNQYDQGEEWIFTLYTETGAKYYPSAGSIIGIKSDGYAIAEAGELDDESRVVITETQQMTAAAGQAVCELSIDGGTHGTANFVLKVEESPIENSVVSETDIPLIEQAIVSVGQLEDILGGQEVDEVVSPIISDWLDEHITNPSSPPIDTSLTVSGSAADAKVTGDVRDTVLLLEDDLADIVGTTWDSNGTITSGENAYQYNAARTTTAVTYSRDIVLCCDTGYRFYVVYYNSDDSFNYATSLNTNDVYVGANVKFRVVVRSNPDTAGDGAKFSKHIHVRSANYLQNVQMNLMQNGEQLIPAEFEPGTYSSAGAITASGKYIRSRLFEVTKTTVLKANTGYKFSVFFYDTDGTTLLYQSNMVEAGTLLITKGDKIKIIIGTSGNTYYITNMLEWLENVVCDNAYMDNLKKEMSRSGKQYLSENMSMGNIVDGVITHNNSFVCTKDILSFDRKVLVHADDGYMFGLAYYDANGDFVKGEASSKYDLVIPANTRFRLVIRKVTTESSTKSALEYMKHVTISYFDIEEKYSYEWWGHLFGIAHGGADGYAPINTLPSFKYAIKELHQILMECDLRFTSDDVPVLLHNSSIDATSDGTGEIASMTYAQVSQYDFGSYYSAEYTGTPIGTLEGLLKLCKDTGVYICIEIKTDLTDTQLGIVKELVDKYKMNDRLMFAASSIARYRRMWQYFDHPQYLWNLLYIPTGGVDASIADVAKVNKNKNIICSLYRSELTNTDEIQKLLDADIRICNASVISNADVYQLPEFVTMSSAHADMQDILRNAALA